MKRVPAKPVAAKRRPGRPLEPVSEGPERKALSEVPARRAERAAERRAAILHAALDEFGARGFAAARLEDVAKRAGVAKGTIYLHFADKEALFQELIRSVLVPVMNRLTVEPPAEVPTRTLLEIFAATFMREVATTRRADVLRLIMAEGVRFPSLAEFHFRNVVEPGLAGLRRLIQRGIDRGEIRNPGLAEFPQLAVAPAMLAVVWQGLFGHLSPLDVEAMMRAHIDLIFGERSAI